MTTLNGSLEEQIRSVVNIAVRAPSTHNSQPWKFSTEDNTLSVFVDESVRMPKSDPEGRYKFISIGYLLHHLQVVGNYYGVLENITITPNEDCVAKLSFTESSSDSSNAEYKELFEAIEKRQNLRGPFSDTAEIDVVKNALVTDVHTPSEVHVELLAAKEQIHTIAELTAESMRRVYRDPEFRKEMSMWIKPNNSKEKQGIHGYSLNQKLIGSLLLPHIIRMFNVGSLLAKLNYKAISSAQFGLVYATEGNTKQDWLSVGMKASAATLSLLAHGYNTSIFVASLEHEDTKNDLAALMTKSCTPQFVMVGGKILVSAPKTPRYTFKEKKA